ncbi:hypothetical protein J3459_012765 [Metarhizium acridum]|nr:hypothetical protein J3459_012765 [Metarhizium acridum]
MAPKLHTLELYGMGRHEQPITNIDAVKLLRQPLPTRLRNIRFLNSVFFDEEDRQLFLKPLIEHCAGLERFTMQLRACQCFPEIKRLVSPGDLVNMLETQKKSLKYLNINYLDPHDFIYHPDDDSDYYFEDDSDDDSDDEYDDGIPAAQMTTNAWYAPPNLATFPVLEELHIDEQSFCHHWRTQSHVGAENDPHTCLTDIVPQSIQRLLVLVRPTSRTWGDICHFSNEAARGRYPNLNE